MASVSEVQGIKLPIGQFLARSRGHVVDDLGRIPTALLLALAVELLVGGNTPKPSTMLRMTSIY